MSLEHVIVARFESPPALLGEYSLGERVSKLRFSPVAEIESLVALLADSPRLAAWQFAASGELREPLHWFVLPGQASRVFDLAFSQRGDKLALAGRGTPIYIVDYPTLTPVAQLGDPAQRGYSALTFCRGDSCLVAAGNGPQRTDVVKVSDGEICGRFWSGSLPAALAVQPEGELIAESLSEVGGSEVRFVHLTEAGAQPLAPGVCTDLNLGGIVWNPSGRSFAVVGGWESASVTLYSFPHLREKWSFMAEPRSKAHYSLDRDTPLFERVVFSPCGQLLLAPTETGEVAVLSTESGECVGKWPAHNGAVTAIEADPSGRFVVTAGEDRHIRVWASPFGLPSQRPQGRSATKEFLSLAQPVSLPIDEYDFEELSTKLLDVMHDPDLDSDSL